MNKLVRTYKNHDLQSLKIYMKGAELPKYYICMKNNIVLEFNYDNENRITEVYKYNKYRQNTNDIISKYEYKYKNDQIVQLYVDGKVVISIEQLLITDNVKRDNKAKVLNDHKITFYNLEQQQILDVNTIEGHVELNIEFNEDNCDLMYNCDIYYNDAITQSYKFINCELLEYENNDYSLCKDSYVDNLIKPKSILNVYEIQNNQFKLINNSDSIFCSNKQELENSEISKTIYLKNVNNKFIIDNLKMTFCNISSEYKVSFKVGKDSIRQDIFEYKSDLKYSEFVPVTILLTPVNNTIFDDNYIILKLSDFKIDYNIETCCDSIRINNEDVSIYNFTQLGKYSRVKKIKYNVVFNNQHCIEDFLIINNSNKYLDELVLLYDTKIGNYDTQQNILVFKDLKNNGGVQNISIGIPLLKNISNKLPTTVCLDNIKIESK